LVLSVFALATGFVDLRVRGYPTLPYAKFIPSVVDGTADAPERYRILIPFLVQFLGNATGISSSALWYTTRLASILIAYLILYWYLRTWFLPQSSLLGVAIVAATLPLTFTNSWAHPDHIPELALSTLGCWLIATGRTVWFALCLAIATLNRETSAFLIVLFAIVSPVSKRHILLTVSLALEWTAIYAGLRLWRGYESYALWQASRNLGFLKLLPAAFDPYYRAYAYFGLALLGPLCFVATRNRSRQPFFVRRALYVVPVMALVVFCISSIIETRVFTPFYPIALPGVMFGLNVPINETEPV
jgi:hypothetical protein